MKTLLMTLALAVTTNVFGAAETVLEASMNRRERFHSTYFSVNENSGRAWVEAKLRDSRGHGEDRRTVYRTVRSEVPGLKFAPSMNAVVIEVNGSLVECGQLVKKRVLGFELYEVHENGNCVLAGRAVNQSGVRKVVVSLDVK